MTERTLVKTFEQAITPEEKLAGAARTLINERMRAAYVDVEESGEKITGRSLAREAFLTQKHRMETANTDDWTTSQLTTEQTALAILEAPFEAEVQRNFSELHPSQRRKRAEYVAILSQYNRDVASCLAMMSPRMIEDFPEMLFNESTKFIESIGGETLKSSTFKAITAGIRREVAVWRALKQIPEWKVKQATVEQDAQGIDLTIEDGTGYIYSIDIKSAKAFYDTTNKFEEKGSLTRAEKVNAQHTGFLERREGRALIDADRFGELGKKFDYPDPSLVQNFIRERLKLREQRPHRSLGRKSIDIVNNVN